MYNSIPHYQLEVGQQVWIVSKNLEWLVEIGTITELPSFTKHYIEYKNKGGFYHKILSHYKVFDNEETALQEAAALLEGAKSEVTKRLLEIKNKGEKT
jgi:hypothetical protein